MMGFVFRLIPPRPDFAFNVSEDERATMIEHIAYWTRLATQAKALAFGPVDDPEGSYGIAIILAGSREEAEALRGADPALLSPHDFVGQIAPMLRLVTPGGTY
jgi:uncharacterized protein